MTRKVVNPLGLLVDQVYLCEQIIRDDLLSAADCMYIVYFYGPSWGGLLLATLTVLPYMSGTMLDFTLIELLLCYIDI